MTLAVSRRELAGHIYLIRKAKAGDWDEFLTDLIEWGWPSPECQRG